MARPDLDLETFVTTLVPTSGMSHVTWYIHMPVYLELHTRVPADPGTNPERYVV